jgi:hypothetical protein
MKKINYNFNRIIFNPSSPVASHAAGGWAIGVSAI